MNTAVINIKIDPKTKKEAKIVADELGFSLSSLTVALLKQVIRKRSVNFNLNLEEPSPYLIRILKQNRRDFKAGRISPTFTNAQDALKYLQGLTSKSTKRNVKNSVSRRPHQVHPKFRQTVCSPVA